MTAAEEELIDWMNHTAARAVRWVESPADKNDRLQIVSLFSELNRAIEKLEAADGI